MSTEIISGQASVIDPDAPASTGIAANPFVQADRAGLEKIAAERAAAREANAFTPIVLPSPSASTESLTEVESTSNSPFPPLASIYPTSPDEPENVTSTGIRPTDTFENTDPRYWLKEMVFEQTPNIDIGPTSMLDIKSAEQHISAALADVKPFINYQHYFKLLFGEKSFQLKDEAAEAIAKIYINIKQKQTTVDYNNKPIFTYQSVSEDTITQAIKNINTNANGNDIKPLMGDPVNISMKFYEIMKSVTELWLASGIDIASVSGKLSRNLSGFKTELERSPLFLVGIREPSAGLRLRGESTDAYVPVFLLPNGTFRDPTSTTSLYPKEIELLGTKRTPFITFTDKYFTSSGKDTRISQSLGNKSKTGFNNLTKRVGSVFNKYTGKATRKIGKSFSNLRDNMSQRISNFQTSRQSPPASQFSRGSYDQFPQVQQNITPRSRRRSIGGTRKRRSHK
jgi:hypothetical protein